MHHKVLVVAVNRLEIVGSSLSFVMLIGPDIVKLYVSPDALSMAKPEVIVTAFARTRDRRPSYRKCLLVPLLELIMPVPNGLTTIGARSAIGAVDDRNDGACTT